MNRSCTRCRSAPARTRQRARLRPGCPAAPEGDRLPLLPSGPDGVHGPTLRGTRPSTSSTVSVGERHGPRPGIQLRCSGLRIQGTASSPPSTTGRDGRRPGGIGQFTRISSSSDAGGGEGGIRTHVGLPRTAFPVPRPRPLGDLSEDEPAARADGAEWRRGWDSNPRYGYPHTAFRERHLQPLGHLSAPRTSLAHRLARANAGRPGERAALRRMRTRWRGAAPPTPGRPRRPRPGAEATGGARAG
jgi:hypothetical protein